MECQPLTEEPGAEWGGGGGLGDDSTQRPELFLVLCGPWGL